MISSAALTAVVLLLTSCGGSPDGDTWLISLGDSTITVAQAGEAWSELSQGEKEFFLSRSNQFGEFIVSLARKTMLVMEIERLGYLSRQSIISLGDSWARRRAFYCGRDYLERITVDGLGEEDIDFFRDHMGTTVWFTLRPDEPDWENEGPCHLPELQRNMAVHLDSMAVGMVLPLSDGTPVRLDSVYITDPEITAASLEDTARIRELALSRYASVWSIDARKAVIDSILTEASPVIRSETVLGICDWYSGDTGFPGEDTVVVSGLVTWTVSDVVAEVELMGFGVPVAPESPEWVEWLLGRMLEIQAIMSYLETELPDTVSVILRERDDWMLSAASESLYIDAVSSTIEVTDDMTREVFDDLTEIPVIPEKRSIECVEIRLDRIDEYREALEAGTVDDLIGEFVFMANLSADDPPTRQTRPLAADEIPGGNGGAVFSLGHGDTASWSEPLLLVDDFSYFAFRLRGVYPSHEATFEEIRDDLVIVVRTRLEEERTNNWLLELEERYGLRINETILDDLPADPAMWKEL